MRRTIPHLLLAAIGCVAFATAACGQKETTTDKPRIAIVYTGPHPVINEIIDGFKSTVLEAYPKAELIERHANGRDEERSTAVLAAISDRPTVLAPITTPITKIAVEQARSSVPIVFMGVTNPLGDIPGVSSIDHPGVATGSSDLCPFAALLDIVREVRPDARRLGLPYNPTDPPAVFGREQLIALAKQRGLSIEDQQVTSATELPTVVRSLASRTDAVIIAADNLMMENPALVASSAAEAGRPAFACDSASVEAGAVAGVSVNYREVGVLAGRQAVQVLQGKTAGDIPIAVLNSGGIVLNRRAACTAHVELPAALIARAANVIDRDYACPP